MNLSSLLLLLLTHHIIFRSRSEEAISEYREGAESDRESVYKGLRVLDHPTSMYNIPQTVRDEGDRVIYDSPKPVASLVSGAMRCPSPEQRQPRSTSVDRHNITLGTRVREGRSHSVEARHVLDEPQNQPTENRPSEKPRGNSPAWMPPNRDLLNESTSSDASAGRRGSRGSHAMNASTAQSSPVVGRINRYSPAQPSPLLQRPEITRQPEVMAESKSISIHQSDLNQAVDNLRVSQCNAENGAIPKINGRLGEPDHQSYNGYGHPPPQQEWSGYSRYDYRNTNPYMYGDLRNRNSLVRPQPIVSVPSEHQSKPGYEPHPKHPLASEDVQTSETFHAYPSQAPEQFEASNYLDMDR